MVIRAIKIIEIGDWIRLSPSNCIELAEQPMIRGRI